MGIDILSGCKGEPPDPILPLPRWNPLFLTLWGRGADPGRQFDLVALHIQGIQRLPGFDNSKFIIYVERNLGFEAEHHKRALSGLPNVRFYVDESHDRVGVLTTNEVKHGMCRLTVLMLEEKRIHVRKPLVSRDPKGMLLRLREQMEIYSYQFKAAVTTFQKDQVALSGKVGGMKDDICICLQLALYFTQIERQRDSLLGKRARML